MKMIDLQIDFEIESEIRACSIKGVMMDENMMKKYLGDRYSTNHIINFINYWIDGYDKPRALSDLDCLYYDGDLNADTIFSVWTPIKFVLDCLNPKEKFYKYNKYGNPHKTQEITNQLKTHSDTDKLLGEQLKLQEEASKRLEEQLHAQAELDRLHSEQLQAQAEIDKLHEEQIRLQVENDKKLLEKLKVQEEVDLMHAEQLKIHAETDKKFEKLLETQAENDRIHDEKIKEQELKMNIIQDEINQLKLALETKANSTLLRTALGLAGLSTVIAAIACFL